MELRTKWRLIPCSPWFSFFFLVKNHLSKAGPILFNNLSHFRMIFFKGKSISFHNIVFENTFESCFHRKRLFSQKCFISICLWFIKSDFFLSGSGKYPISVRNGNITFNNYQSAASHTEAKDVLWIINSKLKLMQLPKLENMKDRGNFKQKINSWSPNINIIWETMSL